MITTEMIYEELLKLERSVKELCEDLDDLRAVSRETVRILAEGQARNDAQKERLLRERLARQAAR
jgi:regulator of replication initiation timing